MKFSIYEELVFNPIFSTYKVKLIRISNDWIVLKSMCTNIAGDVVQMTFDVNGEDYYVPKYNYLNLEGDHWEWKSDADLNIAQENYFKNKTNFNPHNLLIARSFSV